MRGSGETFLYIGKANSLRQRVAQHFEQITDSKHAVFIPLVVKIDYIPCASEREALLLERRLIHQHQPFFNVLWKDEKSYPYVKLTMGDDFPRLILTRRKLNDGGAYFGPYPKVAGVKNLLRTLWRQKLFPLRPCSWEFSQRKPLDPKKINSCLYYHTRECPAPCAGRITPQAYRSISENAALFFSGDYEGLKRSFSREMAACSKNLDYEKAALMRDNLKAISHMAEKVRVRSVREEDLSRPLSGSRAVSDLQKALNLANPPLHIECFDISHFAGKGTCGSMVCFKGGFPHKNHYRRFKIRESPAIDDFKAIEETVRRRYKRLSVSGQPLPDLVLIDGGKGQLTSALKALASLKLKLPIASLAKREEEVYLPGQAKPLILDRHSPALRLLQSLRDEAHRFGVKYNRLLRGKSLFKNK